MNGWTEACTHVPMVRIWCAASAARAGSDSRDFQQATGSDYELAERFAVTRVTILQPPLHVDVPGQVCKDGLRGQGGCSA